MSDLVPPPSDFPIKLRSAKKAEIDKIAAVKAAAYWSVINHLEPGSHNSEGYYSKVVGMAKADAAGYLYSTTVAELEGKIVGVSMVELHPPTIAGIWVIPAMQGFGIGRLLLESAIVRLNKRGLKVIKVEVHPINPAILLYERFGFKRVSEAYSYSKGLQRDIPIIAMKRWT